MHLCGVHLDGARFYDADDCVGGGHYAVLAASGADGGHFDRDVSNRVDFRVDVHPRLWRVRRACGTPLSHR